MSLLREWAAWNATEPPYVFDADRTALLSARSEQRCVTIADWQAAYMADDFGKPGDRRVHLGLLPQPFCGDIMRASVYVLLLNPGVGNTDYYGEYQVPNYRENLLATLKQQFVAGSTPFTFLDPQFAWHGGYRWWHGKLADVIARLATTWSVSFAKARARVGRELASIELFPYHSAGFQDGGWLRSLPSVELAKEFVREVVLQRVRAGEAVAIVLRKAKAWDLPNISGVVMYTAQQARGAHLSPDSAGGRAILDRLSHLDP